MTIYYFFTKKRSFWYRVDKEILLNKLFLPQRLGVRTLRHEEVISYNEKAYPPSTHDFLLTGKSSDANFCFPFVKKDDFYYRFTKLFIETLSSKQEKLQRVESPDSVERMSQLNQLLANGLISQQEFETKRKEILDAL